MLFPCLLQFKVQANCSGRCLLTLKNGSCAKLENCCHNGTGCHGGSGSKGTNQEGKGLSNLSSLLLPPLAVTVSICLRIRWSPLQSSWQLTSPAQASCQVMENQCHAVCPAAERSQPRGACSQGRVMHEGHHQSCPTRQCHRPAGQAITMATVRIISLKQHK